MLHWIDSLSSAITRTVVRLWYTVGTASIFDHGPPSPIIPNKQDSEEAHHENWIFYGSDTNVNNQVNGGHCLSRLLTSRSYHRRGYVATDVMVARCKCPHPGIFNGLWLMFISVVSWVWSILCTLLQESVGGTGDSNALNGDEHENCDDEQDDRYISAIMNSPQDTIMKGRKMKRRKSPVVAPSSDKLSFLQPSGDKDYNQKETAQSRRLEVYYGRPDNSFCLSEHHE